MGGAAAAALAPEVAIPAALGLVAGAGAMLAGRSEAGTQTEPPRGSGVAAAAEGALEGVRAGASAPVATAARPPVSAAAAPVSASNGVISAVSAAACSAANCSMSAAAAR